MRVLHLEKEMATPSSVLAWEIPWIEELGGLPPMGSQKRHNLLTKQQLVCYSILLISLPSLALENARLFTFMQ